MPIDDVPPFRASLALLPLIGIPVFLAIANQTMVSVALPAIGADLGQLRRLPWLVMGYMLALTVAGPLYGVLGDTWGRARMLQSALVVYIVGALACTLANDVTVLAIGRLVQGLGGGGLMSLSQALISDVVTPRHRGRAQGNISAISVLASTLGPLMGGVMVESLGWRSLFLSTVPLALVAMVVLRRWKLPVQVVTTQRRFDTGGFLTMLALVFGITAALELAGNPETQLAAMIGGFAAIVGLAGLIWTQKRAANPMFPPDLFAIPAISRAAFAVFCHGAALVSLVTTIPLFHAILRTDGAIATAISMVALTVAFGIAGFITGNLLTLTGRTVLFPALTLPLSVGLLIFLSVVGPDLGQGALMATYLAIGLSLGTVMSVMFTIIQVEAPSAARGRAAGAVTFFRSIGAVVGTALTAFVLFAVAPAGSDAGAILSGALHANPAELAEWRLAFQATFLTIAAIIVVEWLLVVLNPARRID